MVLKIFISPLRKGHWVVKTRHGSCQHIFTLLVYKVEILT